MAETEFSTAALLEIELSDRSLRDARDEIEDELAADVGVDVDSGGAGALAADGGMADLDDRMEFQNDLAVERNEWLEEIHDVLEQGMDGGGFGGGGGLLGGGGGGGGTTILPFTSPSGAGSLLKKTGKTVAKGGALAAGAGALMTMAVSPFVLMGMLQEDLTPSKTEISDEWLRERGFLKDVPTPTQDDLQTGSEATTRGDLVRAGPGGITGGQLRIEDGQVKGTGGTVQPKVVAVRGSKAKVKAPNGDTRWVPISALTPRLQQQARELRDDRKNRSPTGNFQQMPGTTGTFASSRAARGFPGQTQTQQPTEVNVTVNVDREIAIRNLDGLRRKLEKDRQQAADEIEKMVEQRVENLEDELTGNRGMGFEKY